MYFEHPVYNAATKPYFCLRGMFFGRSKAKSCLASVITLQLTHNIVISLRRIKVLVISRSRSGYAVERSVFETSLPASILEV